MPLPEYVRRWCRFWCRAVGHVGFCVGFWDLFVWEISISVRVKVRVRLGLKLRWIEHLDEWSEAEATAEASDLWIGKVNTVGVVERK